MVRKWHSSLARPADPARARLRAAPRDLQTPPSRRRIEANPCHIRGAGNARGVKNISRPPSTNSNDCRVGPRVQADGASAAWCALRFGELIELRRPDVDLRNEVMRVQRGAVRAEGEVIVDTPKCEAGVRDVAIPPHLIPVVKSTCPRINGRNGLLFPAADGVSTMAPSTLYTASTQPGRPRPPGSPFPRPTPHWRGARGSDRRDARRTHGPARPLHTSGARALPARRPRQRRANRRRAVPHSPGTP